MTRMQLLVLIAGPVCIAPVVIAWLIFPMYLVGGKWEHRSVFSPPSIEVGNSYARLSPADIDRMSKDPQQAALLAKLRGMPGEVAIRPFWIGSKYGDGKNRLFGLALLTIIAYVIALKLVRVL